MGDGKEIGFGALTLRLLDFFFKASFLEGLLIVSGLGLSGAGLDLQLTVLSGCRLGELGVSDSFLVARLVLTLVHFSKTTNYLQEINGNGYTPFLLYKIVLKGYNN